MAGFLFGPWRFLVPAVSIVLLVSLPRSEGETVGACRVRDVPLVESVSDLEPFTPSFPGLAHTFVAGMQQHGVKEVEVWLETLAAGSGTPIHRHASEEVIFVLKGSGIAYIQKCTSGQSPGEAEAFPLAVNSTARLHANVVHQIVNTNTDEDLQILASISQPPMKAYVYLDWSTPHDEAAFFMPFAPVIMVNQCQEPGLTIESGYLAQ